MSNLTYDAFISYSPEDKKSVARPLAFNLAKRGYRVWFDEFELKPGDSIRRSVDSGLTNSRKAIVIIGRTFFEREWAQYEVNGLLQLEIAEAQPRILPVWHGITRNDLLKISPSLADKVACNTADGIEVVGNSLSRALGSPLVPSGSQSRQELWLDICPLCGKPSGIFVNNFGTWLDCPSCNHLEVLNGDLDPSMLRFHQMRGYDDI
jgi:hypothetical protein